MDALTPRLPAGVVSGGLPPIVTELLVRPTSCVAAPCGEDLESEGLLHDARNLMGALGLYCDLLSMPSVLKPEHLHYAEEVRLLSSRSTAMIQRLMEPRMQRFPATGMPDCRFQGVPMRNADASCMGSTKKETTPVSLRSIVERSSGLLRQVACGRAIEICFGAAAAIPVRVAEESVERILVNLVRNAAAALGEREPAGSGNGSADAGSGVLACSGPDEQGGVEETLAMESENELPGAIRISVGLLVNRVGDPRHWPFRRVRLTVEEAGCGMTSEQLERLLSGGRAPSRDCHGIGFRVVRELVASSGGDLRVLSGPGIGTRVQIEWPMAAVGSQEALASPKGYNAGAERRHSC